MGKLWHRRISRFQEVHRRIDETNQRMEAGLQEVNRRMEAGLQEVNRRVDEGNRRMDRLLLAILGLGGGILVALVVLIVRGVME